jgi:hypothetical protein
VSGDQAREILRSDAKDVVAFKTNRAACNGAVIGAPLFVENKDGRAVMPALSLGSVVPSSCLDDLVFAHVVSEDVLAWIESVVKK